VKEENVFERFEKLKLKRRRRRRRGVWDEISQKRESLFFKILYFFTPSQLIHIFLMFIKM